VPTVHSLVIVPLDLFLPGGSVMAIYPNTARIVRVRLTWDWNNGASTIMNHWALASTDLTLTPAQAVTDVVAFVTASFPAILDGAARLKVVECEDLITREYAQAEPANVVGIGGGGALPATVSCIISLRSNQRRRYRNGRFRVGGINRSLADGDILSTNGNTAFTNFALAMSNRYVGGAKTSAWSLVVYTPGNAAPSHGTPWLQSAIDVDTIRIAKILSTVRTRRVGVGI
jgi:hypothetical protein